VELGQLVKSLAGRDKGKHYFVIGFEGRYVLLVDGRVRSVDRPKNKNVKHLQPYRYVETGIQEEIKQNALKDTTVRNALNTLLASEDESGTDSSSNTHNGLWLSSSHGG